MWRTCDGVARSGPSLIFLIGAALLPVSSSLTQVPPAGGPSPPFGPQPTITCPAGAVEIRPGNPIQSTVNFYPGATTFCLRAGVHYLSNSITPKTGDVFVGEYGAILDGTRWTTSVLEEGAFRAHSQDIDNVTIRNLVIRNMPQRGIHTYSSGSCVNHVCTFSTAGADRWIVENNEIHHTVTGIEISNDMIVRNNYIHHNVGPDPNGSGRLNGGGVEALLSQRVLFENNEIAYNGTEQKMASLSPNTIARGNWVHHNLGSGIWFDGENPGSIIENNLVEDNASMGIFYEISGRGVIRNNTIRRNGDNGILVATSHSVELYGNILEDNFRGINFFVNCSVVGSPSGGEIGEQIYMQDVSAHDNMIIVSTRSGSYANGLSYASSCTSAQLAPYLNGSKHLTFSRNNYRVPLLTGWYWLWGETKNWSQWQSLGHDIVTAPQLRER